MSNTEFYTHNLSPFIFRVADLKLEFLASNLGMVILFAFCPQLVALVFTDEKKYPQAANRIAIFRIGFLILSVAFISVLLMKKFNFDWGLRWYSTMYLLGFIFCYSMCRYWIRKGKIMLTPILLDTLIAWLILGMITGARLAYVFIYNWDAYKNAPADLFRVWEGGLSFHGGIVGVVLAIFLFCRKYGIQFWHLADRLSFTVPLGIGLGRFGNFMNGELYGRIVSSDIPWAIIFPDGGPQPRHPSQLYQSLGEGWFLYLTVYLISRIKNYYEGTISVAFIGFYGFFRYFMEFFREPDAQLQYYFGGTTTMGQILCGVTVAIALSLYFAIVTQNVKVETIEWQSGVDSFLKKREALEA